MLALLALLCFLAATIWSVIQRAWPFALTTAGLFFLVLAEHAIQIST